MLFFASALFWILIIWSLVDGSLYFKEALIWSGFWAACILGFLVYWETFGIGFVAAICLIDAVLLIKLVGNPSVT